MAITKRKVLMAIIKDSVVSFLEESGTTKTTDDEVKVLVTCMSNMVGNLLDPSEIDEVYKSIAEELELYKSVAEEVKELLKKDKKKPRKKK